MDELVPDDGDVVNTRFFCHLLTLENLGWKIFAGRQGSSGVNRILQSYLDVVNGLRIVVFKNNVFWTVQVPSTSFNLFLNLLAQHEDYSGNLSFI